MTAHELNRVFELTLIFRMAPSAEMAEEMADRARREPDFGAALRGAWTVGAFGSPEAQAFAQKVIEGGTPR